MDEALDEIEQLLGELHVNRDTIAIIDEKIKRLNEQNTALEANIDEIDAKIGTIDRNSDAYKEIFDDLFEKFNNVSLLYAAFVQQLQIIGFEYTGLDGIKQAQTDFEAAQVRLLDSRSIEGDVVKYCNKLAEIEFDSLVLHNNNQTIDAHDATLSDFTQEIYDTEELLLTASDNKINAIKARLTLTDDMLKNRSMQADHIREILEDVQFELQALDDLQDEQEAKLQKYESYNSTIRDIIAALNETKIDIKGIGQDVQLDAKEVIDIHFEQNTDEMMGLITEINNILNRLKLPEYNATSVTTTMKNKINNITYSTNNMK